MESIALGLVGMLLVVAGWAVALRGPPPPLKLSILYTLGSLLLTLYAISIGDPVFTILNAAALLFAALNSWRALRAAGGVDGEERSERGKGSKNTSTAGC